jgi:hypothetical protein
VVTQGAGEIRNGARFERGLGRNGIIAIVGAVVTMLALATALLGASRAEALPAVEVIPGQAVYEARGGSPLEFYVDVFPNEGGQVYAFEFRGIAGQGSVTGLTSTGDASAKATYKAPDGYIGRAIVSIRAINQTSGAFSDGQVIVDVNPKTELTAGPGLGSTPGLTTDNTPTFDFRAVTGQTPTVINDATFECKLDSGEWSTCTSPYAAGTLADGSHTFSVRAKKGTDLVDPQPASANFTVDTISPSVSITGGPTGRTKSTDASFAFTNDDPTATVECKLDSGSWEACSSPKDYSGLAQGDHTFQVRATDPAGNEGSANQSWTADTVASVTIDSGPSNGNTDATPTFAFSSPPDVSVGFRCRVYETGQTAPPLSICSSPYTSQALNNNVSYTFEVKVTDDLGNTDSKTSVWNQSNTAPSLGSPTVTVSAGDTAEVDLSSGTTDADGDTVGSYTVTSAGSGGIGGQGSRITPGTANSDTGSVQVPTAGNAAGTYTFTFSASDGREGGTSTNGTATVKVRPDTKDITDPATPISDSTPEWSFTAVAETADFECRVLTSADVEVRAWESCFGGTYAPNVVDGTYKIQVRAKLSDLVDDTPLTSGLVEVDTASPDVDITGPADLTGDVDLLSNIANPAFTFATTDTDPRVTFECRTDEDTVGVWKACSSSAAYAGLSDGNRTFSVRAVDAAGNKANSDSFSWERDTTEPEFEITSGPDEGDWTNLRRPTWVYTESDPNPIADDKNLLPATTTCKIDSGSVVNDCPATWTAPSFLNDGEHTLTLTVQDTAGNTGTAEIDFTVATTSPGAFLEETPESPSGSTVSFEFMTPSELGPEGKFQCRVSANGGSFSLWQTCTSPYSPVGLQGGLNTFQVRAVDSAGNSGSGPFVASHTWQVIGGTPGTTINASAVEGASAAFSFSSDDGFATFECRLNDATWSVCSSPKIYENLPYGQYNFQVRAVNQVGEIDPTPAVQIFESGVPQPSPIVFERKPAATTSSNFAAFKFGVLGDPNLEDHNIECRLDGEEWEACDEGNVVLFDLALGEHTFEARAVHKLGVGNNGAPESWTWNVIRDAASALILPDVSSPPQVRAGRSMTVTIKLRNVGGEVASGAEVCLRAAAVLKRNPGCKTVSVGAGSTTSVRFKVTTRAGTSGKRAEFRASVEYLAAGEKRKELKGHVTLIK